MTRSDKNHDSRNTPSQVANAAASQQGELGLEKQQRCAKLLTGTITTTFETAMDSERLFGFGERINPKRSFVFVSRVLGRHIPVAPTRVRESFTDLADFLPADLPGPVLMTSMAETAVGLGAGVHDAYLKRTSRRDVLNLSSTRARRPQSLFAQFSEDHSHASGHTLYLPENASDRQLLTSCRTLVMVDDETSSGNTMKSLGRALYDAGITELEQVFALTLTDWSSHDITVPSDANSDDATQGYVQAQRHALLTGKYEWQANDDAPVQTLPDPDTPSLLASAPLQRVGDARIGNSVHTPVNIPEQLQLAANKWKNTTKPILVLGTGEHVWEPLLLAEKLAHIGLPVLFSSTTRSPIKLGHDISCAYTFNDHEGLGIKTYVYNVNPEMFSNIIICIDTAMEHLDSRLVSALGAHIFFDGQFIEHEQFAANNTHSESLVLQQQSPNSL